MAAYADWSPASVFGSTMPVTADASRKPKPMVSDVHSREDSVAAVFSEEEWRSANGVHAGDQQTNSITASATSCINSKQPKKKTTTKRKKADATLSRKSDVDNAIRALQQQSRVRRLYAQEKAHEQEAQTLRRELEKAAVALLSQSFQRYRLRCAIDLYVRRFERKEDAVRRLLQVCEQAKRLKEAVVSRRREEREQHVQRAAVFLWTWYKFRQLIRHKREHRLNAHCRIAWWWRSIRLKRRCQRRHHLKEKAAKRVREQCKTRIQRAMCRFVLRRRLAKARTRSHIEGARRLAKIMRDRCLTRTNCIWKDQMSRIRDQIVRKRREQAAAQMLQRFLHEAALSIRQRRHREARIVVVQSLVRRHHARRRYLQHRADRQCEAERKERERIAAVRIQAQIRGVYVRVRFAKTLKQLRERFQCLNCGVIEPGGVYCKLCGRRRTNFEPLRFSRTMCAKQAKNVVNKQPGPSESAMIPTPPVTLHQSSSRSVRNGRHRRLSDPSSYDRPSSLSVVNSDLLQSGALKTLPAVLSPRHFPGSIPVPAASAVMIGASTKLRAQALVGLQLQQERAGHTQAMALHLQRLQRGSQVVRRSR